MTAEGNPAGFSLVWWARGQPVHRVIISWRENVMYHYPPNSIEFKRGYRLGIEKGRRIERKLSLILLLVCMSGWVLFSWVLSLLHKCS
jgi:hypothetical protein